MSRRGSPQNKFEIEKRRLLVAQLYAQKNTQIEIAKILNVDRTTISLDIKAIKQTWRAQANLPVETMIGEKLAEIEEIKRLAVDGYHKKPDPRFLEAWIKALDRESKLLGLDAPTRQELLTNSDAPLEIKVTYVEKPKENDEADEE